MSDLPPNYEVRSRKEWEELLKTDDPVSRGKVNQAMRAWGAKASEYLKFDDAKKIEYLLTKQAEAGYGEEKPAANKTKVSDKKVASAEPASEPPAKTAAAATPASGGGAALPNKQLADIQAQLVELGKELIAVKKMVLDIHYLAQIETVANAELAANAADEGCREEYYGKLLEGND